jgi:hypothetical protein
VLARSEGFSGDELRHRVTREDGFEGGRWAAKPVALRFELKNAELFAFAFRK